MCTLNKVLVGLVALVSLGFFFFAARCLRARDYWGESLTKHEEALDAIAQQKALLIDGQPAEGTPGIRQLQQDLHALVLGRGRVWRSSMPKAVNQETGQATVVTQLPAPHKDVVGAQMYVFQDPAGTAPGAFLGEFVVGAVAGPQWELRPARPMTEPEIERLRRSRGPWSLYELMPAEPMELAAPQPKPDQAAGAETAGTEAAKPQPSQPAKIGSPEWVARLVDFHVLLSELYRQRTELRTLIDATLADAQTVEAANKQALEQVALLNKEIAATGEEIKAMKAERDLVAKHLADVQAKLAELKDAVQKTDLANRAAAAELARLQLEAIRRIDERTSKIAQAPRAR